MAQIRAENEVQLESQISYLVIQLDDKNPKKISPFTSYLVIQLDGRKGSWHFDMAAGTWLAEIGAQLESYICYQLELNLVKKISTPQLFSYLVR